MEGRCNNNYSSFIEELPNIQCHQKKLTLMLGSAVPLGCILAQNLHDLKMLYSDFLWISTCPSGKRNIYWDSRDIQFSRSSQKVSEIDKIHKAIPQNYRSSKQCRQRRLSDLCNYCKLGREIPGSIFYGFSLRLRLVFQWCHCLPNVIVSVSIPSLTLP